MKHAEVKSGNAGLVIDRTYKVYIGGKQLRPDGNYSRPVLNNEGNSVYFCVSVLRNRDEFVWQIIGKCVAEVAEGNRKDIRDAVEAAHAAAPGWGKVFITSLRSFFLLILFYADSELLTIERRSAITLPRISWHVSMNSLLALYCRLAPLKTGFRACVVIPFRLVC